MSTTLTTLSVFASVAACGGGVGVRSGGALAYKEAWVEASLTVMVSSPQTDMTIDGQCQNGGGGCHRGHGDDE